MTPTVYSRYFQRGSDGATQGNKRRQCKNRATIEYHKNKDHGSRQLQDWSYTDHTPFTPNGEDLGTWKVLCISAPWQMFPASVTRIMMKEVRFRLAIRKTMVKNMVTIRKSRGIWNSLKLRPLWATALSVAMYGSEAWYFTNTTKQKIDAF